MKRTYIMAYILTILFLASLLTGASIAGSTNNVISVKEGQTFNITLPSNPSTGFEWHVVYNTTYLQLVNQSFQSDNPGLPGAGGNQTFTFKALKSGETNITFNYQRGNTTPVNTTTFDIKITGNNTNSKATIPMLPTGAPLAGLTLGVLAVLGGIVGARRNNK